MKREVKRVIYFNSGAVGEFLMTLFFMMNIKSDPASDSPEFIVFVQKNKGVLIELAELFFPSVKIIIINKRDFIHGGFSILRYMFSKNCIVTQMTFGQERTIVKVLAHLMALRSGSVYIGCNDGVKVNKYLYSRFFNFNPDILFYETMNEIVKELGFIPHISFPYFKRVKDLSKTEQIILEKYVLKENNYLVLHPFAANSHRSFPARRWNDIINSVLNEHSDIKIVVTGAPSDDSFARDILSGINDERIVNLVGVLSMDELVSVIKQASLFIGVDSGITHLAGVLQKKSVVIGNYSNPCWLPVYNKQAVILLNRDRCVCSGRKTGDCFVLDGGNKYYRCMMDIKDENILNSIHRVL